MRVLYLQIKTKSPQNLVIVYIKGPTRKDFIETYSNKRCVPLICQ